MKFSHIISTLLTRLPRGGFWKNLFWYENYYLMRRTRIHAQGFIASLFLLLQRCYFPVQSDCYMRFLFAKCCVHLSVLLVHITCLCYVCSALCCAPLALQCCLAFLLTSLYILSPVTIDQPVGLCYFSFAKSIIKGLSLLSFPTTDQNKCLIW